jgi:glycosyltransferase involved in cell wall biosynthesis
MLQSFPNMNPIKVSICMISYNHAKFIEQAIESILRQETEFPIELVIGDDFSTDETSAICQRMAGQDARIRLLPTDRNLGVMPNLARTLQACKGEYIAICEGDDYWTDMKKLSKQALLLDTRPEYSASTHQSQIIMNNEPVRKFREGVAEVVSTRDLTAGRLFHTASVLFRRPVVDMFCNSPAVLSCDRLLNFCMSFLGKIHFSEEIMCVYRIHGLGMSSNATIEQMRMDLNCIDYLKSLQPEFPKFRYLSYVYATIGLRRSARWHQKLRYLGLSFFYSFSYFPENIKFYFSRMAGFLKNRVAVSS